MKKKIQRVLSMLLALAMICTLLPAVFAAGSEEDVPVLTPAEPGTPISQEAEDIIEADIWSVIDAFEDENIVETRADPVSVEDYAALSREIEELVLASDTYVEDSLIRNGEDNTFFTWETTEGIVCGYSPEVRYRTRNVDTEDMSGENITTKSYATKGGSPTSTKVYLISPYYNDTQSADSSFTDQYKNEGQSIASGIGGTFTQYGYTAATITNIATAMMNGAVVLFDSHGTTDYDNGNGNYTARANTSYLCLKSGTGITSADMAAVSGTYGTYYHAFNGGSAYCVDGTAIANHMTSNAPSSILWMAICLGMATNGLNAPMRAKGVEVVYGYSQSVTFTGDYKYEASFWDSMLAGNTVAQAISTMKSRYGKWDPAYSSYSQSQAVANYAAFPIVVSDEDTYPGQGNVDAVQTVYSTYTLFGDGSGSGTTTPTDSITISFSCPSGVSASAITTTAGTAFTLPTPTGTPTANAYAYSFAGWVTSAVSDTTTAPTIYEAGASVSAQSSLTLYALYTYTSGGSTYYTTSLQSASTSTPITISFSCPAGVSASAINTTAGTSFTLPTPTGTPTANAYAYTFAGWVTSTVSATTTAPTIYEAGASVYAEESLTLYALYTYTSGGSTYYTTSLQNASGSGSTEIESGTYVLAANVNGTYYAMSNTFASKISGTAITVTDGYVSETDAEGYAITLTKSGSSYTISNGTNYLKYSSSTNLGTSTTAYNWTISEGVNGSWRFTSATSGRGLVYRAGATNQFGGYALSNATATSTEYYDIEILPIKASGSSGDTEESTTVYQITSSSQLGNDTYVFLVEATGSYSNNSHYGLITVEDEQYYCLNSVGADFDSVPASLSVGSSLLWNVTYSNGVLTIRDSAGNYLSDTSTSSNARLQLSTTSCTWTPTFYTDGSVSLKSPNGYYLSLRDDQSTMGTDGNPMFHVTSSLSTGSAYFFLYRKTQTDAACSHSNTSTSTVDPTCTTAGSTTVTCDDCGETISTETIAATGHNYQYSSTVAPTATEQGYDIYVCANCGAEQYQNYTDATGETFTVTFLVPEGVTAIADVECTELTLPVPQGTPTNAPADYSFLGWVSAAVDNSATKPTTIYDTTSTYTLSSDITLYALYTYGGGETTRTFTLYDGTNSIYIGDTVIIVAAAYDYAMGSTQNTNNRAAVAITRSSDGKTITTTDEAVGYFTLGWGVNGSTESSKISFKDSNGYLYAASSSGNYLRSKSTLDANGTWTLNRTTTNNTMNFVAQGTYTRNTMQYNASSNLFACYSSASQSAIQMYVLTDESAANATYTTVFYADTTCQHSNTSTNTVDATCTTAGSVTVTCDDCGETISTETIAATGHQNTSTTTVDATCTTVGSVTVTCDDCGETLSSETIPATGHQNTSTTTVDATCTTSGSVTVTCDDCGETLSSETIAATGHQNTSTTTVEATCTTAGSVTVTCDDCGETISTETIPATGHSYVDGICSACGATQPPAQGYEGRYYIASIRSSGNYYYMSSDLGTASTKRYQAVDTGLTTLPASIADADVVANQVFVLEMNADGTYKIYAESVSGSRYLGWTSGNSGTLVAVDSALALTVDYTDGIYNIHFAASDSERYLALNNTTGNNYFAWYKTGQKQNLVLIPIGGSAVAPECQHENTTTTTVDATCTENGSVTVTCDDCGEVLSTEVIESTGHDYTYTNNGDNHTIVCSNGCGYSATEDHTYVDGSCICGAEEVVIPADPTEVAVKMSHTVSFDSDLKMNYRIKKSNIAAVVPNYVTDGAYLVVEKDRYPQGGGEKTVETVTLYPDLTTDAERMLFSLPGIQSVEMGSELRAVLHFFDADGNEYYTTVDTYSVLAYAQLCFDYYSPETDGYLFTMLIDCMNYGAASQVNFDRRADELVNAGLEAYQQYATTELSAELTDVRTYVDNDRSITAVTAMGFNVTFADKTEINAKLTIAEGYTKEDITSVKVLNEAGEVVDTLTEFTELDDGRLQVTFTGVNSVNMRDMYYFVAYVGDQVASQNVGYSIEAYAKNNINSADTALAALVRNCIYYGDSAKVYFDSLLG